MGVETITGTSDVDDLNTSWPADTEFFSEGAAHLRNLKQMFKNLFTEGKANSAALADNASQLNGQLPAYYLDYNNLSNVPAGAAPPNDATITISAGTDMDGGGSFTTDQSGNATITVNHADTSTQASVSNSGDTVIQSITVDGRGHITGITSKTLSIPSEPSTSVGAVGTYAMLLGGTHNPGTTAAGSGLRYTNGAGDQYNSSIPSGTWRCMGYSKYEFESDVSRQATLWVRIS